MMATVDGNEVVLQTQLAPFTGTYTVLVGGDMARLGTYPGVPGGEFAPSRTSRTAGRPITTPTSAQAINGSSIAIGAGDQLAVVGRSGDADVYSFELAAGQTVSAGLKLWQSIPSFGPHTDYVENPALSVALGDVNNDGVLDMVNSNDYSLEFLCAAGYRRRHLRALRVTSGTGPFRGRRPCRRQWRRQP